MINELAKKAHAMQVEKGFVVDGQPRPFGVCIALIHSELSEALEGDRDGLLNPTKEEKEAILDGLNEGNPTPYKQWSKCVGFELADAMIRIMATAEEHGIEDLEYYITTKMKFNASRAPRHGRLY